METFTWNWENVIANLLRVGLAFVLAFPIGWERSHAARSVGLRTFPMVAIASCGYMLIATRAPDARPCRSRSAPAMAATATSNWP